MDINGLEGNRQPPFCVLNATSATMEKEIKEWDEAMIRELRLCKMYVYYSTIELLDGTWEKQMTLGLVDEDGATISLPIPECIFSKFAGDLTHHFKEFKQWRDTGKLPPRKTVNEEEKKMEFEYHQ